MPEWQREKSLVFGGRTITVEVFAQYRVSDGYTSDLVAQKVEVLSKHGRREGSVLTMPSLVHDNPLSFDRFIISPDDRIIIADRKIGSGINQTFVFECVSGLHYRLADHASLNKRIEKQYGRPKESRTDTGLAGEAEFVLVQEWLEGGRKALLACFYPGATRSTSLNYFVTLDTRTGRLFDYYRVREQDISTRYAG